MDVNGGTALPNPKVGAIYRDTFKMLKETPTVWFLFIFTALLDFLALSILYYAPSDPVAFILAPIIRAFWDDRFLHYPDNFILLPKLFNHAHFLISAIFGILITGIAIKKIEAYTQGKKLSTLNAMPIAIKKYFPLLFAWLIVYGAFVLTMKLVHPFLPANFWIQLGAGLLIGVLIQSLFAFLLPAIILQGNGFFPDMAMGMKVGGRYLLVTSGLIFIPMILVIAVSFLKALSPSFIRFNPELVLAALSVGIVISMIVDLLITASTTLLFLRARTKQ